MLSADTLTCFCCLLKIKILFKLSITFMLIAVIDNNIQTHTTLFCLSSKLSVKASTALVSTAKLCRHCTIAARSCQLSLLGGRLFTQTNEC